MALEKEWLLQTVEDCLQLVEKEVVKNLLFLTKLLTNTKINWLIFSHFKQLKWLFAFSTFVIENKKFVLIGFIGLG
jgi:hypothetical protein